jgi:hypothetical protein
MSAKFQVLEGIGGRPYAKIQTASGDLNFGREKARAIVENIEAIKAFLASEDAKAAAKVTPKAEPKAAPKVVTRKAKAAPEPHGGAPANLQELIAASVAQAVAAAMSQAK